MYEPCNLPRFENTFTTITQMTDVAASNSMRGINTCDIFELFRLVHFNECTKASGSPSLKVDMGATCV